MFTKKGKIKMGKYLKDQYEMRDISKALAKVHHTIDEEYEELCDKIKNLTLSHNRERKLLKMCKLYVEWVVSGIADFEVAEYLHKRLTLELYGLEGYEGLKVKGGKR